MHSWQLRPPWRICFEVSSVENAVILTAKALQHCEFKDCLATDTLHQDPLPPLKFTHLPGTTRATCLSSHANDEALQCVYEDRLQYKTW